MMPSKYEPGDEPDANYCDTHTDYLRPCRVCRFNALIERAEERYKERDEQLINQGDL